MAETCAACGGEIGGGDATCPSCGLVFVAPGPVRPIAPAPAPEHVGLLLGGVPGTVAETDDATGAGEERESPVEASSRKRLTPRQFRTRVASWIVVVLASGAAAVYLVATHRPDDEWTRQERAFERLLRAPAMRPVELPARFDPDARVAQLAHDEPDAMRVALSASAPLAVVPGQSLHGFFDEFLARALVIAPDWSFRLGVHPHPSEMTRFDATTVARWQLLMRDLWRGLDAWPGAGQLSPHDRADREALRDWAEVEIRRAGTADEEVLVGMQMCADPLVRLAEIACCRVGDRADAASARIEAMPERLRGAVARLANPARPLVLATIQDLEDVGEYLLTYADQFGRAPEASKARLRAAIPPARAAIAEVTRTLRFDVLPHAKGELGMGAANVELLLRVLRRLPLEARDVYEQALAELRRAHDDMRRLGPIAARETAIRAAAEDATEVRSLGARASQWVVDMPPDAGIVVVPIPAVYLHRLMGASYADAAIHGPTVASILHIGPPRESRTSFGRECELLQRRHMLAHESYPGHRLEALFRREACALRQFVDDRLFVEGWAVYSEDVLHETNGCEGTALDDYVRAGHRASKARAVMISLLIETGAAPSQDLLTLLRASGWPEADEADLGARAGVWLYSVNYLTGRDEIRRLRESEERRLGAAFDLRAFHTKLLREGPIPPRLIEAEWRAATR